MLTGFKGLSLLRFIN